MQRRRNADAAPDTTRHRRDHDVSLPPSGSKLQRARLWSDRNMRQRSRRHLFILEDTSTKPSLLRAALITLATCHAASAAVLSGSVTTGSGIFEYVIPGPGFQVGQNNQNSPNLFAFDEDKNITLGSALTLGGAFPSFSDYAVTIPAGTVVASHYVFYDPAGTTPIPIVGPVTYDAAFSA